MKKSALFLWFFLAFAALSSGQTDTITVKAEVVDGDTLALMELNEVILVAPYAATNPDEAKRLAKLIRMVKKVYPYARLAGIRFKEMNGRIEAAQTHREKKKIIGEIEDEIKDKYGEELKKLTFSQGKILIKLVDRETGQTSYNLVKEFKGAFMAFFYQNFARIWGYNLKTRYDPEGEDKDIELIVTLIESGRI